MGWFSDQLKQRRKKDDEALNDSLRSIANAITKGGYAKYDNPDEIANNTIEEVLKYFNFKLIDLNLPKNEDSFDKRLNLSCSQYGINYRSITLADKWYKDSIGPLIATFIDGTKVALIPDMFGVYHFIDYRNGQKLRVNRKTAGLFQDEAILFYKPLPLKSLTIKDLLHYMSQQMNGADILLFFGLVILTTALGFLTPLFTKWLMSDVLVSKSVELLISLSIFMVSFTLCSFLIKATKSLIDTRIKTKIDVTVQSSVMSRLVSLPPHFFKQYSSGELTNRVMYVQMLCSSLWNTIFGAGVSMLFSLTYLFQISALAGCLVIPSLIIALATILVTVIATLVQMRVSKKAMEAASKVSGITHATITGIQKIKISGAEKRMFSRWAKAYSEEARLEYNPPFFLKINAALSALVSLGGTILLYYVAAKNNVLVADYYAFTTSYGLVFGAFSALTSLVVQVANIKPILEIVKPFLEEVPELSEGKKIVTDFTGSIELDKVSFRYAKDLPLVIDNLSLKIKRGEYVAIVGKTGCGKSTLVRLLLGFENPSVGSIYYDNNDINRIDLKSLRRNIGTVMQGSSLFTGDIYSNITITAPQLSMKDAMEVAKMACIDQDIADMPMGMHTLISEGQGGISGGQKQRLMIARALANKPKILIFDEATSALDNITQKKITEAIDGLKCTRIVIAHRLSTIRNADRIIYLEGGKVAEQGTYDELIAKNGLFADLVERQRLDK